MRTRLTRLLATLAAAAPSALAAQTQVTPTSFAGATVCSGVATPGWVPASPLLACYALDVYSYTIQDWVGPGGTLGYIDVLGVRVASLQGRDPRDNTTVNGLQTVRLQYDPSLPTTGGVSDAAEVPGAPIGGATVPGSAAGAAPPWWLALNVGPANASLTAGVMLQHYGVVGCNASIPDDPSHNDETSGIDGSTCPPGSSVEYRWLRFNPPVVGAFDASRVRAFDVEGTVWDGSFYDTPAGPAPRLGYASCQVAGCQVTDFRAGQIPLATVPEPASLALVALGLLGVAAARRLASRGDMVE